MQEKPASEQIDDIITLYGGWKGRVLTQIRSAVLAADPSIEEAVKWRMKTRPEGLPVWSHDGIVCLAETFKDNIKLVFTKGALMADLQEHFNARLGSLTDRAIEFHEDSSVDATIISKIVQRGVQLNESKKK